MDWQNLVAELREKEADSAKLFAQAEAALDGIRRHVSDIEVIATSYGWATRERMAMDALDKSPSPIPFKYGFLAKCDLVAMPFNLLAVVAQEAVIRAGWNTSAYYYGPRTREIFQLWWSGDSSIQEAIALAKKAKSKPEILSFRFTVNASRAALLEEL